FDPATSTDANGGINPALHVTVGWVISPIIGVGMAGALPALPMALPLRGDGGVNPALRNRWRGQSRSTHCLANRIGFGDGFYL
ncbi:MAG TPA: hypothetical protein VLA51_13720, partial [Paracoccaceae bacterium]|nr:hypothetical protein [Paracoccaceae bacterium]